MEPLQTGQIHEGRDSPLSIKAQGQKGQNLELCLEMYKKKCTGDPRGWESEQPNSKYSPCLPAFILLQQPSSQIIKEWSKSEESLLNILSFLALKSVNRLADMCSKRSADL